MKLRQSIGIATQITKVACAIALIPIIFTSISKFNRVFFIPDAIGLSICIILLVYKPRMAKYLLNKTDYPGVFYGVCKKLSIFRDFDPGQQVLDDLYKPVFLTETFLADNQLNANVSAYSFTPEAFITPEGTFAWGDIDNWQYGSERFKDGHRDYYVLMILKEGVREKRTFRILSNNLPITQIDFTTLLVYYKNRYGHTTA
jgi:hypothetical protein